MDLRQLTAVVTVAEVGSVTKAARLLHRVQPALTRQIRLLEEELGVPLFQRTPQGMTLTADGHAFAEHARRALDELDRAREEIQPPHGEVTGVVTVGMLESVAELIVSRVVTLVQDRHPRIELRILTAYSGHLQEWLDDGQVDLSLLYDLRETPSRAVLPLLTESLWLVGPPEAALRVDCPVRWADALSRPLVVPVHGHGLRTLIERARSSTHADLDIAVETNSLHTQKALVVAHRGWTVLPAAGVAGDVALGRLSAAPLVDPDVVRSVVIGYPRSQVIPPAVQAVASSVAAVARILVRGGQWPTAQLNAVLKPGNTPALSSSQRPWI